MFARSVIAGMLMVSGLAGAVMGQQAVPAEAKAAAVTGQAKVEQPRIDVVFVLDTTGSMSDLIEGAKAKIWAIANQMATARPRPQIRVGLVGYRDRGDEYVTKLTPLTDDLDAVYADLMKFKADGGGDGPESVNQALNEAVTKFEWSKEAQTLKLVYLVGDAPPHMDYEQDVKYLTSCELAAKAGLTVNTIQCGNERDTTPVWQEIARKAEGEFFQIEQSGGMTAIATPFDTDLAKLGTELESTVVAYGTDDEQRAQTVKMSVAYSLSSAPAAPAEASADRAVFKSGAAGKASLCGDRDLVQACQDKQVDLAALPKEQFNKEMQDMTPEQRRAFIDGKTRQREECQKKIGELDQKRQAYIKEKLAAAGANDKDWFDKLVFDCLKRQGAKCGLVYGEAK